MDIILKSLLTIEIYMVHVEYKPIGIHPFCVHKHPDIKKVYVSVKKFRSLLCMKEFISINSFTLSFEGTYFIKDPRILYSNPSIYYRQQ